MFYSTIPQTPISPDITVRDATAQGSRNKVVSMEDPGAGTDKWVYVFYIDSDGTLGFNKSTDNGATFGGFVQVDASPTTYIDVAVWYEPWTDGTATDVIHVAGVNTTDQGIRYFQVDTANTDTVSGDVVALADTTVSATLPFPSICMGMDGQLYVACTMTSTAGVHMAWSDDDGATWNDDGLVSQSTDASDIGKLVPAKTDNDIMMFLDEVGGGDTFSVIRWDAIGDSWALSDNSTVSLPVGTNWDVVHEPTNGDSYLIIVSVAGNLTTLAELETYFYDESADTIALKGTRKLYIQLGNANTIGYPSLLYDTNNTSLICMFVWGSAGSNVPQIMTSYDEGALWGDPTRATGTQGPDDYRYTNGSYHIIDESLGGHFSYFNDDLDDVHTTSYIFDRITANVVDNSDVAASGVDVLIFSVDPDNSLSRTFHGRAISDGSGNWAASVLDVGNDNIEIQMIYDEDLANDEVDASHRLAVDSF